MYVLSIIFWVLFGVSLREYILTGDGYIGGLVVYCFTVGSFLSVLSYLIIKDYGALEATKSIIIKKVYPYILKRHGDGTVTWEMNITDTPNKTEE